ncbi:isochorismatase [Amylibacter marinus]|uniref:Isochorismatase n=1 Tax=Amylibacter marinus TaxID=1475483 RepID=A0ABQ5VUG5_9RHOB|nr:isochorismatase family protein [Amylibacter marinus]GLQ34897.1 isochorismatase [Amylibacter marinus]
MADFALIVIDVQQGFADRAEAGDGRSCPEAEVNIAHLLAHFRMRELPIIHVHHHSLHENSPFHPSASGVAVQEFATPKVGETVIVKEQNSAFVDTNLADELATLGDPALVICGATANHCVETTTRMAGNMGYDAYYVSDAVWAFGIIGPDGISHSAEAVHSMSLANLDGEFAKVQTCTQVLAIIP